MGPLRAADILNGEDVNEVRDVEKLARVLREGKIWLAILEAITDGYEDKFVGDDDIVDNDPVPGCLLLIPDAVCVIDDPLSKIAV